MAAKRPIHRRTGSGRPLGSVASLRGPRRSADREGSRRRARRGHRVRRALSRPRGVARRAGARARARRARGAPGAGRARGLVRGPRCSRPTRRRRATARCSSTCRSAAPRSATRCSSSSSSGSPRTRSMRRRCCASRRLARRRHFLAGLRRYRDHVLSEPEERVLAEAHNTGSAAWSRLFDQIMADLSFEVVARRRGAQALRGGDARAALRPRPRDAPRRGGRPLRRAARERARARLHLQHPGPGQGRRRPPPQLSAPDGRAPPRQRGAPRERRRAARRLRRALRPRGALLPAQGAPARAARARRLRPLCAARRRRGSSAASPRRGGS